MSFEYSDSIAALAPALAIAQGAVEGALKDTTNPHFRTKYADLASVWAACRKALSDNGLSVIQSPGEIDNGKMGLTTMLLHKSGEWVRGHLTIPLSKVDAQGYGSATTYARRYALAAFVGVSPEDDDGNAAASGGNDGAKEPKPAPKTATVPNEGTDKPKTTLASRAASVQRALNACTTVDDLRATYNRAAGLCADLDQTDPELLVEVNALYERLFAKLTDAEFTNTPEMT